MFEFFGICCSIIHLIGAKPRTKNFLGAGFWGKTKKGRQALESLPPFAGPKRRRGPRLGFQIHQKGPKALPAAGTLHGGAPYAMTVIITLPQQRGEVNRDFPGNWENLSKNVYNSRLAILRNWVYNAFIPSFENHIRPVPVS